MIQSARLADIDPMPLLERVQEVQADVVTAAQGIFHLIQRDGDSALRELTKRLDGVELDAPFLDPRVWDDLAAKVPAELRHAIDNDLARIEAFHRLQVGKEQVLDVAPGLRLGRRPVPYPAVGCYVPGGRASYPSTALMTVVPARLAEVPRIIVATPPRPDGTIDPAVAYAAKAAGATDVLLAGGAQAVAALALGTKKVPKVGAIVGPGNAYVTAAKRMAADLVATDAPAGPSELLVLADADAEAAPIAWDLIAQAEHDPDAQVLLVTDSQALADGVLAELEARVPKAPRQEIITASLRDHGLLLVADSFDDAVAFADAYAAEHLEIHCADPHAVLDRIQNAGSVFLGPSTPVSLGDYGSGTNHVLPTMGYARLRGGLAVDDFRKWITWQEATPKGLAGVADDITRLARAEGLVGHAQAVERRLEGP